MIELINYFGNDLMIVNVARVSYGKISNAFSDNDNKLLNYLIKHKHTSPFRHPQLQFRITCPIYIERQLFKHQVGMSANSISGRYVDFSDSYTPIKEWRKQSTSSKQGSEGLVDKQEVCSEIEKNIIDSCSVAYDQLISLGVSKEQARTILPLNLNTTFMWTGSLLSFLHLWDLRLKKDAQVETREVAQEMLTLIENLPNKPFQFTLEAWKQCQIIH